VKRDGLKIDIPFSAVAKVYLFGLNIVEKTLPIYHEIGHSSDLERLT
jgi:hypothetical protein